MSGTVLLWTIQVRQALDFLCTLATCGRAIRVIANIVLAGPLLFKSESKKSCHDCNNILKNVFVLTTDFTDFTDLRSFIFIFSAQSAVYNSLAMEHTKQSAKSPLKSRQIKYK